MMSAAAPGGLQILFINPVAPSGITTAVLSWDLLPGDLDWHIRNMQNNGAGLFYTCETKWNNKICPNSQLDLDRTGTHVRRHYSWLWSLCIWFSSQSVYYRTLDLRPSQWACTMAGTLCGSMTTVGQTHSTPPIQLSMSSLGAHRLHLSHLLPNQQIRELYFVFTNLLK